MGVDAPGLAMIDLHSHTLPGLCDGSQSLETSLQMARMAVEDGVTHLACTPHIYPHVYDNSTATIAPALADLQSELDKNAIPLRLLIGADVHLTPDTIFGLKKGVIPTLNHSRYFLLEPSHHVPVDGFLGYIENFVNAGYVPVITHPERLKWVETHYEEFLEAARLGAWIQLTAGAVTGHFGRRAQQWSERFLLDGYVHILATDAHGVDKRPPILSAGMAAAAELLEDETEARRLVFERPQAIVDNLPANAVTPPPALQPGFKSPARRQVQAVKNGKSWLSRLFG